MNFLKRIWRKIFRQKVGVHDSSLWYSYGYEVKNGKFEHVLKAVPFNEVYDPSLDAEKILKGESESYFD